MSGERHKSNGMKDDYGLFLDSLPKVPLLEAEEEVELAKRIEAGLFAAKCLEGVVSSSEVYDEEELSAISQDGKAAKKHLLEANIGLVVSRAGYYRGAGIEQLDLIQEGFFGLDRAVNKFDYTKGYKFSTYATKWISKFMEQEINTRKYSLKVGDDVGISVKIVRRAASELTEELGRKPSMEELAERADRTLEEVEKALKIGRLIVADSIDMGSKDDEAIGAIIVDAEEEEPVESEAMAHIMSDQLWEVLHEVLDPEEAEVVILHYGIRQQAPMKLDDIGPRINKKSSATSSVLLKARNKLKENPEMRRLKPFLFEGFELDNIA